MALSNSVNFTMTASELIENSFSKIGIKKMEQPLLAPELQDGLDNLNLMMKAWQAQGLHLWSMEEGVCFLDAGVTNYSLGPTGDHACAEDDFIGTDVSTDAIATATVLLVDDTTGMVALDNIGIELDDGTRQWTTIVSVDSATQVTITAALTGAATTGNSVFTYTTLIDRPMRILSFRRKTYGYDDEIEVKAWPRNKYFNQTNKTSQGTIVNAFYSPQLTDGKVYVWQTASNVNQLLRFTYEKPLDDIDLSTNNLEFPVEWLECISDNLAARLGMIYDVPMEKMQMVTSKAAQSLDDMLGWDEEMQSLMISPTGY